MVLPPVLKSSLWKKRSRRGGVPAVLCTDRNRRGIIAFCMGRLVERKKWQKSIIIDKVIPPDSVLCESGGEVCICGSDPVGLCGQPALLQRRQ